MAISLPRTWWDQLFDGKIYNVILRHTGYTSLANFRAACYREADLRECLVATHKAGIGSVIVQAWGNPDANMEMFSPRLREATLHALPAPEVPRPLLRSAQCTCGHGPRRHLPSCALSSYLSPVPPPVDEDTDEALLGPCTCGQAPACLPSCARAGGDTTAAALDPAPESRSDDPGAFAPLP